MTLIQPLFCRYDRAVRCVKGQVLIKELLLGALPELPEQFDAKMEALYQIYMELGHEDWAEGMTGEHKRLGEGWGEG